VALYKCFITIKITIRFACAFNYRINSVVYTLKRQVNRVGSFSASPAYSFPDIGSRHSKHWRRLVKNIWWENQNFGRQDVVQTDKCMGVPGFCGALARAAPPPKSTP